MSFGPIIAAMAALALATPVCAADYSVNRSFQVSSMQFILTGTVGIPEGNYVDAQGDQSPFTSVNLTLRANGADYILDRVITDLITGNGRFFIEATPTALKFDASGGGSPADLMVTDLASHNYNQYLIGYEP